GPDQLDEVGVALVLAAVAGVLVLGAERLDERHRRQRAVLEVGPEVGLVLEVGGPVRPVFRGVVAEGGVIGERLVVELEAGIGAPGPGQVGPSRGIGAAGAGPVGPAGAGGHAGGVGPAAAVPGPGQARPAQPVADR